MSSTIKLKLLVHCYKIPQRRLDNGFKLCLRQSSVKWSQDDKWSADAYPFVCECHVVYVYFLYANGVLCRSTKLGFRYTIVHA